MEYQRVLQELSRRVELAKRKRDEASARFDQVIRDAPSGIPHPDGTERIRQASRAYEEARQELQDALLTHNDFILYGTVPPDLKE